MTSAAKMRDNISSHRPAGRIAALPAPVRFQPDFGAAHTDDQASKTFSGAQPLALYVHVPFCVTRCYFCDFVTVVGKHVSPQAIERYVTALQAELAGALDGPLGAHRYETAQIGGGTPTMLDAAQLASLLDTMRRFLAGVPDAGFVVEGFPTSVSPDKLAVLRAGGDVKFNMGVQTFDDDVLEAIGRRHERDDAIRAISEAKRSGLRSVGIDLIYGLPRSGLRVLTDDIQRAIDFGVDHVALYPLWVYPQTRLNSLIQVGVEEDSQYEARREQLAVADEALRAAGYHRYTAFHYARGPEHFHGYGLWQMRDRDWLGVGQAAVSQLDGSVYENERTFEGYVRRAIAGAETAASVQRLADREQMVRHLAYGIREARYPVARFRDRFGVAVEDTFGAELDRIRDDGLAAVTTDHIELSLEGVLRLGDIEQLLAGKEPNGV